MGHDGKASMRKGRSWGAPKRRERRRRSASHARAEPRAPARRKTLPQRVGKRAVDLGFADPERPASIAQDGLHLRIAVETLAQGAHLARDPLALGMLLPAELVALAPDVRIGE